MSTEIILVRHGQSLWNNDTQNDRYNGLTDVPLSKEGIQQAALMSAYLKSYDIAAFYSSPLMRAFEMVKIIANGHGSEEISVDNRFIEIDFGGWEGLNRAEINKQFPELYRAWKEDPGKVQPPDGETAGNVLNRAYNAVLEIAQKHEGQTVLIGAHKNTNRILLCSLMGIPLKFFRNYVPQRVGALNIFTISKGHLETVKKIDDHGYLASY